MAARNLPGEPFPWNEADRMFTLLVKGAAELAHCPPGSAEEEEFDRLVSAIEAYEAKRWPGDPSPTGSVKTVEEAALSRTITNSSYAELCWNPPLLSGMSIRH